MKSLNYLTHTAMLFFRLILLEKKVILSKNILMIFILWFGKVP